MGDFRTTIHNLQKGKSVDYNLNFYIREMMTNANRLSFVRAALNYPVFYESASEIEYAADCPECISSIIREITALSAEVLRPDFYGVDTDAILEKVIAVRESVTRVMQTLTAFGDRYTVYEYVLNRKEYSYKDTSSMKQFDDETFRNKIMAYVSKDSDQSGNRVRLVQILEQVPMRMTRSRFAQIIEDGLRAYIGSEKSSVEDLLYMIRTGALLEEPEEMRLQFPVLYEKSQHVVQCYNQEMTEEEFLALQDYFADLFQILNDEMDCVLLMQEIVNDMCTILLSAPHAMGNREERDLCVQIIQEVNKKFANPERPELGAELDVLLSHLEGRQEALFEQKERGDAVLEEFREAYKGRMDEEQLALFAALGKISLLLSTSHFGDLKETDAIKEEADEAYVMQKAGELIADLKARFKTMSRPEIRAVMAKALTMLPLFVRNYNELESYIDSSLANCTDQAEKMACVEIINQIIDGGNELD